LQVRFIAKKTSQVSKCCI